MGNHLGDTSTDRNNLKDSYDIVTDQYANFTVLKTKQMFKGEDEESVRTEQLEGTVKSGIGTS